MGITMIDTKRALVGDLHLGAHSNSENWHQTSLNFARFLRDQLIDLNVTAIEFFGDFFDNRNEIGVQTLHVASEFLDILAEFDITIICGNHDMFFKNRTDVHSISILSGRKNIKVIDTPRVEQIGQIKVLQLPWGGVIDENISVDMVFGHLELNGFYMMAGKPADGKIDPNEILKRTDMIFSGHFHLRDERKYSNGKTVVYIGSPYQLNWGEASNIPGFYIMDFNTKEYTFIENTVSPRHIKMFSDEPYRKEEVEKNIVSFEFGSETPEEQMAIRNKLFECAPSEVKFTNRKQTTIDTTSEVVYDDNINLLDMMFDFVDNLNIKDMTDPVKDTLKELYTNHAK